MTEEVIRHPLSDWESDSLGETTSQVFGPDVTVWADRFDPGGSTELNSRVDAAVETKPTLYFRSDIDSSPHDEWTVRGLRYEQDGEAGRWRNPRTGTVFTVVRLGRRTG